MFSAQELKAAKVNPKATAHRIVDFNHRLGFDELEIPCWRLNEKRRAANFVDIGTSFQIVAMLPQGGTGPDLRRAYVEHLSLIHV